MIDFDDMDDGDEEDYSAMTPADDPVRMYLKEIGQVPLLEYEPRNVAEYLKLLVNGSY